MSPVFFGRFRPRAGSSIPDPGPLQWPGVYQGFSAAEDHYRGADPCNLVEEHLRLVGTEFRIPSTVPRIQVTVGAPQVAPGGDVPGDKGRFISVPPAVSLTVRHRSITKIPICSPLSRGRRGVYPDNSISMYRESRQNSEFSGYLPCRGSFETLFIPEPGWRMEYDRVGQWTGEMRRIRTPRR